MTSTSRSAPAPKTLKTTSCSCRRCFKSSTMKTPFPALKTPTVRRLDRRCPHRIGNDIAIAEVGEHHLQRAAAYVITTQTLKDDAADRRAAGSQLLVDKHRLQEGRPVEDLVGGTAGTTTIRG